MPTNANAYNSRITDETLEKKFRDSFRSQGGAELVDDLYASGVIVPVIDFSAAALGTTLSQELQQAWDFTTGTSNVSNGSATAISNAGFWKISGTTEALSSTPGVTSINITDGLSTKIIWRVDNLKQATGDHIPLVIPEFLVFLRSGDSLTISSSNTSTSIRIWYRQIATLSGDLVNPSGFTSS